MIGLSSSRSVDPLVMAGNEVNLIYTEGIIG
jgi:hypothetical protein